MSIRKGFQNRISDTCFSFVTQFCAEAKLFIKSEYARYGQTPTEDDLEKISKDLLSKEKEAQRIFENLYSKKVLGLIKEKCTLQTKEVSYDEFFKN